MLARVLLVGLGLICAKGAFAESRPPSVMLRELTVDEQSASAPLTGGGRARLTLDPHLQQAAHKLLKLADPVQGAVVVVHAPTGKVLVWAERQHGSEHPPGLLYQARAPAASVFKIVTTAALLERAKLSPSLRVCYDGGIHGIERRHLDPPRSGGQCGPFGLALGHSRNAVYAQLATRYLMREDLLEFAERFGFGQPVPFEAEVPMGTLEVPYNDLEFARSAVGFRGSRLSPLGALRLAYAVAAGGENVRLRILEKDAGENSTASEREVLGRIIDRRTAEELTRMMEATVRSGTSRSVFQDDNGRPYLCQLRVAGKTGTLRPNHGTTTTSWFTGFVPSRHPELVVTVLMLNGRLWRRKANEIARDLMRVYFAERGACQSGDPFKVAESEGPREGHSRAERGAASDE
jgi:cell division protein FtsI/penicillin-binding protein 2